MADEELASSTESQRTIENDSITVSRVWGPRAEEDGGWGARTTDIVDPEDPRSVGDVSGSGPWGESWTPTDPTTVTDYRDEAGLPEDNRARFLSIGTADPSAVSWSGSAAPLDGNQGGLEELKIPDAEYNVELISVQGLNESWTRSAEPDAPSTTSAADESRAGAADADLDAMEEALTQERDDGEPDAGSDIEADERDHDL